MTAARGRRLRGPLGNLTILDDDLRLYHLGMFFQAIRWLAAFDPALQLPPRELARLGHLVIAAAILGQQCAAPGAGETAPARAGLRLDRD